MAAFLGENALLAKLSTGDIVANELYYHQKCYNAFLNNLIRKKQMMKIVNILILKKTKILLRQYALISS